MYITIEDLLAVISKETKALKKQIEIFIYADCCGAAGAYYRALQLLEDKKLSLNKNITHIEFKVPCDFDEVSYCGPRGGIYTNSWYSADSA